MDSGQVLTKCDQCREMHSSRNLPTVPPCDACWVDLQDDNQDAVTVYQLCRGQVIFRHNGQYDVPVDLNYVALFKIMETYGIQDQRKCLERVRQAFYHFVNKGDG